MWRKYFIGLFVLIFLTSSGALVFLNLDQQNDLSSRASGGISSNKQLPLDKVSYSPETADWDAGGYDPSFLFHLKYDASVWSPPTPGDNIFWAKARGISVRLMRSDRLITRGIDSFLGSNFVSLKNTKVVKDVLAGWTVNETEYKFLNKKYLVEIWNSDKGASAIAVLNSIDDRVWVSLLLNGLVANNNLPKVMGATISKDDSARQVALVRPSVVMILAKYCNSLLATNMSSTSRLTNKIYNFCVWGSGTGFFVNSDGYIATNGHVLKYSETTVAQSAVGLGELKDLSTDLLAEAVKQLTGTYPDEAVLKQKVADIYGNKEQLAVMAGEVGKLAAAGSLQLGKPNYKYYIQLGKTPFKVDDKGEVALGADILEGKFVDADFGSYDPNTGFNGSDVALLKVEGKNFPGLMLGSIDNLSEGDNLQVIGYPGVVSGLGSTILDYSATTEPTITRGVVSAIKEAKGDRKKLIQTDATINKGNSGGPAINSDGVVVGIATYGLTPDSGGGNYNFLRDIGDLYKLMQKNNIVNLSGSTYDDWKAGLDNYWLSYFRYAVGDFNKVVTEYPVHPTVAKYLTDAGAKQGGVEDKTPRFTRAQRGVLMNISGGLMGISFIGGVGLWVWDAIEGRKRRGGGGVRVVQTIRPVETF